MITATQYEYKILELKLDALAQKSPEEMQAAQEQLRTYLQDINREIHVIRTRYQTRISAANQGGSSRIVVTNRQSGSGQFRAEQVERLETERDQNLAPYQAVVQKIEEHLNQIESALGAKS